jgi:hypothetical protein
VNDSYLPPEVIEKLKPAKITEDGGTNTKYKSRATAEILKDVRNTREQLNLKGYADDVRKLDRSGLMAIFRDLAKKTGVSTKIGTYQLLRGHNLRKLFYTLLRNEGVDSFTVEYFMGHTIPEEQAAYFEAIPEKLKATYGKYLQVLFIGDFETKILQSTEYTELKEEIEDYKEALKKRNGEVNGLRTEIEAMKQERAEITQEARGGEDEEIFEFLNTPKYRKAIFELMKNFEKEREKD